MQKKKILLNNSVDSALVITNIDYSVKTLPVNSNQYIVPSPPNELNNDILKRRFIGYAEVQTKKQNDQYITRVGDYVESGSTLTRYTDDLGIVHNAGLIAVYAIPSLAFYYFEEEARETISTSELPEFKCTLKLLATSHGDDYAFLNSITSDRIVADSSISFFYSGSIDTENWLYDYLETRQNVYATPDTNNLIPYALHYAEDDGVELATYNTSQLYQTVRCLFNNIPIEHLADSSFRLVVTFTESKYSQFANFTGYRVQNQDYNLETSSGRFSLPSANTLRLCIRPQSFSSAFDSFPDSWPFS